MGAIEEILERATVLDKSRRILNSVHELGNIFYDKGRFEAYKIIAVLASKQRQELNDIWNSLESQ